MSNVTAGLKATGQQAGVSNFATGSYTGDAAAGTISVAVGFTPRYVRLDNITDGISFEWYEALPATNTIKSTWSSGVVALDTNSLILTNMRIQTSTEVAYPAPGAQTADDGTQGTVSVSYEAPLQSADRLDFVAGSSGANVNVSAKVYIWMAMG